MTTKITLTHEGVELVVMGTYQPALRTLPSVFYIHRIEQAGADVTEHYRRMRLVPVLEDMAREVIESN